MPIYAYACETCDAEIELLQKVGETAPEICPECGAANSLRKQLTAAGFRLKGGGWYETDFKSGNRKNVAGEREAGKSAKKDSAKADTKSTGQAAK